MRFYLIDRIVQLEPPGLARAVKCVSLADDVLEDHFPGYPIFPGTLILEALAQLGGVLIEAEMRTRGRHDLHALLCQIERARFRVPVRPGDRLELTVEGLHIREEGGQVRGVAEVDGKRVAEAELTFAFTTVTHPKFIEKRREILNIWLHGAAEVP